ncbi:UDP-glycosyltransferase 79-like [Phragmites australis]|uniref:UDP-glycosyltransferase 79-like n=1 Tax=Phragmites australis TaxID=29695 RepID=UPI002D78F41D|nr:UDP-glycosyltransferase 79-like [Phragmites australis]
MAATSSPSAAEGGGAHVLLLPYPGAQGHTNPMLQFGRRLAYHGLRPTLVTSRYVLSTTPPPGEPFGVAAISDGFDSGGMASCPDLSEYSRQLEAVGSETLAELLRSEASEGRAVRVLVYDPHLPWARRVAQAAGVATAAFFSQPCSVDLVYGEVRAERLALPVKDGSELFTRGLLGVELGPDDVPPFAAKPDWCPVFLEASVRQFEGLEDADDVLVNSFRDIEPKEVDYMESMWGAKTIGPALPSFYLDDDRLPANKTYGFNLFSGTVACMAWLDKQPPCSVVLVSYGTVSDYDETQLEELGRGLCNSGKPFLWVVRSNEQHKLSDELHDKCKERGLIVSWCPQLEVLAHKATGCFFTHCGWNSTLEAIANGVPMVAIPHWADQPTISKYMESMWGMGVRVCKDEIGLVTRDEVERCIREVMDGERKDEYRRNATMWMQKAKQAMQKGGTADKNITEFAAKYSSI